jgi:hypothetical protein
MPTASIIFERPASPVGYAIAWKSGGDFSHAAVVTPGNWLTEAVPFRGVVMVGDAWFRSSRPGVEAYHFDFTDEELDRGRAFLLAAQKDVGYDFRAILSFFLNKRRQDPDRWFCSELAYGFLNACRPSEWPELDYLIDPVDLRNLLKTRLAIRAAADKLNP